jgi:hypothetical protein
MTSLPANEKKRNFPTPDFVPHPLPYILKQLCFAPAHGHRKPQISLVADRHLNPEKICYLRSHIHLDFLTKTDLRLAVVDDLARSPRILLQTLPNLHPFILIRLEENKAVVGEKEVSDRGLWGPKIQTGNTSFFFGTPKERREPFGTKKKEERRDGSQRDVERP